MPARFLCAVVSVLALSAAGEAQTIWVAGRVVETTPVRIQPTPSQVPLTTLSPGTPVTVVAIEGDWLNIAFEDARYGRRFGYVPRAVVTFALPTPSAKQPPAAPAPPSPAPSPVSAPAPAAKGTKTPPTAAAPANAPVITETVKIPAAPARPATSKAAVPKRAVAPARLEPAPLPARRKPARLPVRVEPAPLHMQPVAASLAPAPPALDAPAGRASVSPRKGMLVTLMIPRGLLNDDPAASGRRMRVVAADIADASGAVSVNGRPDWMLAGLPSLIEAKIGTIRHRNDHSELELRADGLAVTLTFADSIHDPEATLGQVIAEGGRETAAAMQYRDEAHTALVRSVFSGDAGRLEDERKRAILAAFQSAPGSPDILFREDGLYASYDLGREDDIYNDRDYDQSTIVAYVIKETVLPAVRDLATSLPDVAEVRGIRVTRRIPHAPGKNAAPKDSRLDIIATTEHLAQFARGALTSQAFADAAVVTVDGSPVRLQLAGPAD